MSIDQTISDLKQAYMGAVSLDERDLVDPQSGRELLLFVRQQPSDEPFSFLPQTHQFNFVDYLDEYPQLPIRLQIYFLPGVLDGLSECIRDANPLATTFYSILCEVGISSFGMGIIGLTEVRRIGALFETLLRIDPVYWGPTTLAADCRGLGMLYHEITIERRTSEPDVEAP